jgi:N-sulfoglucosamine sulfohydrolase
MKKGHVPILSTVLLTIPVFQACDDSAVNETVHKRPNILFAISDNQSHTHTGVYGDKTVNTPGFDYIASEGILFHNAFVSSPQCAPSRASILTGRYPWQNEEAGGHQTLYPAKYVPFTDVLEESGYYIGYTGKGCMPFNWRQGGRDRDPAGPAFNDIRYDNADLLDIAKHPQAPDPSEIGTDPEAFLSAISTINYAANFDEFLSQQPDNKPFFFWFGCREPHTPFEEGSGLRSGKRLEDVVVPGFLPDNETVRMDLLDYAHQIDWFDDHLMKMIEILRERGELDNTIIIVTSDNGMQFPYAIANCYEYGIHVPLAISWPAKVKKGRTSDDLVNLTDLAPTILEITNTDPGPMLPISAKSFKDILFSDRSGIIDPSRDAIYSSRERHSSARWMNLGYPQRAVRTHEYLYIRNYYPERWPAGAPQLLNPENPDELYYMHGLDENGKFTGEAYHDLDYGLTKTYLIENMNDPEVFPYFQLVLGKRPAEELFNIIDDPYSIHNLAEDEDYSDELEFLRNNLNDFLRKTEDPRVVGPNPDIFENYQRFYPVRPFPKPDWVCK